MKPVVSKLQRRIFGHINIEVILMNKEMQLTKRVMELLEGKEKTTKDIEDKVMALTKKYNVALGLEAEHKVDLKRCDLRNKAWISRDDLQTALKEASKDFKSVQEIEKEIDKMMKKEVLLDNEISDYCILRLTELKQLIKGK